MGKPLNSGALKNRADNDAAKSGNQLFPRIHHNKV